MEKKTRKQYLKLYQQLHDGTGAYVVGDKTFKDKDGRIFDGSNFYEKLWKEFKKWSEGKESFRVLDYGCGKAKHLHKPYLEGKSFYQFFEGRVQEYYLYDPGYKIYSVPPAPGAIYDAVICADVMEHIPDEDVDNVMLEIGSHMKPDAIGFYSISGMPAKKSFLDGENLHCNVQPIEYWQEKLRLTRRRYVLVYTGEKGQMTIRKV